LILSSKAKRGKPMFDIEQGIPEPDVRRGRPPKYPFREMSVGDSFFVSCALDEQLCKARLIRRAGFNVLGAGAVKATPVRERGVHGVRVHRVA
jgi:hypothetical protein